MVTRRSFLAASAALLAAPALAADPFLIVPGKAVGPIVPGMTADGLRKAFGAANVKAAQVHIGEGMMEPGFLVFGSQADRRLEVVPQTVEGRKILLVLLRSEKSRYHTAEGLTLGTPLQQVQALNGRPFELAGFGWDYEGYVTSWKGGRLEKLTGGLAVRFELPEMARGAPEVESVLGDGSFSSDLPAMQKLNPRIGELIADLR